ncbi:MAG: HAMP domain-containing protein, partial [Desulfobulbaceae bacterium]
MTLIDLEGNVMAAGRPFTGTNLADRKHVQEALKRKDFAVGEYIITRVGAAVPAFAFAYPVLDTEGKPKGVLTMAIKLADHSRFRDLLNLPEKSFLAVTDHQGIRLFYYPAQEDTNPIGKPIQAKAWERASQVQKPGIFIGAGSDGRRRIIAFEPIRLNPEESPYLYVWAGIPEANILAPVNADLTRNLRLILLAMALSLVIAWLVGKKTFIAPIQDLVALTKKFSQGEIGARSNVSNQSGELGELRKAFHDMAASLTVSQRTLRENEALFRLLMDSLDELVYVADMNTYEILFANKHMKKQFGDVTGKICWQSLQQGQSGPCPFCTNRYLLDAEGGPAGVYSWEFQNSVTGQWLFMHDRAIEWIDGRIVRLQVATDISNRKKTEEERELLIAQLQKALTEIKTLSGLLPICASCKMIRDDEGYWNQIESYIQKHSEAEFSHGICPQCARKLYPEFTDEDGNIL